MSEGSQMLLVANHLRSRACWREGLTMTSVELAALASDIERWAGLIDRPTCRMELVSASAGGTGDSYRCSACLDCFAVLGVRGNGWRYCPSCGAEVVRDGE